MISRSRFRGFWAVFSLLAATSLAATNTVEFFGLSHTPLGAATFATNGGFELLNIGTNGEDGVSSELGAADSGVFIYPFTSYVQMGYSMRASIYGSLDGHSNTFIGTIYGYRADYAQFYAGADYSAIGATNLTFQLWHGYSLVAETTMTNGEVYMYGEYASAPRVNPWWRQANGEYGASIEFTYPLPVALPGGGNINGDRIFIRPNGATGTVDYVSRTDVFGGGGLERFSYGQVRLGMFGHPHLALSKGKLVARPGTLKLDEIPPDEEQGGGVAIEVQPSTHAAVDLLPLEIAIPNTNDTRHRLDFSATGTHNNYPTYFGSLTLVNTNGVLELSAALYNEELATLEVFSNNVLVGSTLFARGGPPVRIDGMPRFTSFDASADTLAGPASISLRFDTNFTITLSNGAQFVGNRIATRNSQWYQFADVTTLAINASEIPSFTIVGERTEPIAAPQLEIYRSNTNIVLRWPDPAQAYRIEFKTNVEDLFSNSGLEPSYSNGVATVVFAPFVDTAFFRLQRYVAPYYYGD